MKFPECSKVHGFSLVDAMLALAVVALLVTIAIPNLRAQMIKSNLSEQVRDLYGSLSFAQSEAIKRGGTVTLCKSGDGLACGGDGVSWNQGWILFADRDGDGVRDLAGNSPEVLLRTYPAIAANTSLSTGVNYISFDRTGLANKSGTLVFCADGDRHTARALILGRTKMRIAHDGNRDGIPEKDDGTPIASCEHP